MHTDWYYMTISYGSNIISYHSKQVVMYPGCRQWRDCNLYISKSV